MTLFATSVPMVMWYIYGYTIPIVILAVLYGFRWKVGMWGNFLSLGCVLFSILVAIGWWEEIAYFTAQQIPTMLFFADGVAIWGIFLIMLALLDLATRSMSAVKVKFADIVENVGNGIVLFLLFLALYGFFLFAEELGPVGEHANVSAPGDSIAVQIFRMLSDGNLSGFTGGNQFDDKGNFRDLHLQRRQALMLNVMGGDRNMGEGSLLYKGNSDVETLRRR